MPTSLDEKISLKLKTYEKLAADAEVNAICTWNQPNTSEVFDETRLEQKYEASLSAFFALDEAASKLIKAKAV